MIFNAMFILLNSPGFMIYCILFSYYDCNYVTSSLDCKLDRNIINCHISKYQTSDIMNLCLFNYSKCRIYSIQTMVSNYTLTSTV